MPQTLRVPKRTNMVSLWIDHTGGEALMHPFTVITLIVIFNGDQPVGMLKRIVCVGKNTFFDVRAKRRDRLLNARINSAHRSGFRVQVDKDKTTKNLHLDCCQANHGTVESRQIFGTWRTPQLTIKFVSPAMIRADDHPDTPAIFKQRMTTMLADIEKATHHTVYISDHEQILTANRKREVIALFRNLTDVAG